MNVFTRGHRILKRTVYMAHSGDQSYVTIISEYSEGHGTIESHGAPPRTTAEHIQSKERLLMEKRDLLPIEQQLLSELRNWRNQEAEARGMTSYNLGSNEDYINVILAYPSTIDQLLSLRGMGPSRAKICGEAVLNILDNYREEVMQERERNKLQKTPFGDKRPKGKDNLSQNEQPV